jgi:NADP-dependent 3-hydroxy acid dehydrogenase YdfG
MSSKVWFITGTSKGFGRVWAEAALARGDKVVATARHVKTLAPLIERYGDRVAAMTLDVTDKRVVDATITQAYERFGRLDVVVNNAGYGLFGAIEEINEAEARAQIETNLFGALWVTQAALPFMRAQKSGHIIQVSSIGGVNAYPTVGLYHASKWGAGRFQSIARRRSGRVRHQSDLGRTGRLCHRLGRPIGHSRPANAGVRCGARGHCGVARPLRRCAAAISPATRKLPRRLF